jgi:hypothetical protein
LADAHIVGGVIDVWHLLVGSLNGVDQMDRASGTGHARIVNLIAGGDENLAAVAGG